VFVANHTNGLIDPILVITGAACPISPVATATLWRLPGLRWLLDRAGAVNRLRAQALAAIEEARCRLPP
jgi:1-acyl-sn-glycerol-3-phosphate acyltransferase